MLGTAKPTHRKSSLWPTMRGGDVSKRNLTEFTIASNEIQHIVIRNSKICWTEEKCIAMDKLAQEDHSYCPSSAEFVIVCSLFDPRFALFICRPSSTSSSSILTSTFSSFMWMSLEQDPLCTSPNEESGLLVNNTTATPNSHRFRQGVAGGGGLVCRTPQH